MCAGGLLILICGGNVKGTGVVSSKGANGGNAPGDEKNMVILLNLVEFKWISIYTVDLDYLELQFPLGVLRFF